MAREGDFVLWERVRDTGGTRVLDEGGDPGAILDCDAQRTGRKAAVVLDEPVTVEQEDWNEGFSASAPATFTASTDLPAGELSASLQYHSQVPLTVSVDGEEIAELPPSLEGFYLTGAGRGAFWPAGELETEGGTAEIEIEAAAPSGFQDALGVERKAWVGTLAFSTLRFGPLIALEKACGQYVDHYFLNAIVK